MMEIKGVSAVFFSPGGNVKTVTAAMAAAAAGALGVSMEEVDITLPTARQRDYAFGPGQLVFVGTPVYAGRVPNKLSPWLAEHLHGNGTPAVPVVSFGNRSFDNALSELHAILAKNGFIPASAAAVVSEHAFTPLLAPGRPTEEDMAAIRAFAIRTAEKIRMAPGAEALPPLDVPGTPDAPYYTPLGTDGKPAKFLKALPEVDGALCDRCEVCAAACPMGSIPADAPDTTAGLCIKCHACVRACPRGARQFTDPAFLSHREMLIQNYCREAASLFLL